MKTGFHHMYTNVHGLMFELLEVFTVNQKLKQFTLYILHISNTLQEE